MARGKRTREGRNVCNDARHLFLFRSRATELNIVNSRGRPHFHEPSLPNRGSTSLPALAN